MYLWLLSYPPAPGPYKQCVVPHPGGSRDYPVGVAEPPPVSSTPLTYVYLMTRKLAMWLWPGTHIQTAEIAIANLTTIICINIVMPFKWLKLAASKSTKHLRPAPGQDKVSADICPSTTEHRWHRWGIRLQ